MFSGRKETNAEITFTVTEPKLILEVSISEASNETYQKDDEIRVGYIIQHHPTSETSAYNLKLRSNSTMFSDVSSGIIVSELDSGATKVGSVSLVIGELPQFGADEVVRLALEYCSTPTDVGRNYFLLETAGSIDISSVSGKYFKFGERNLMISYKNSAPIF